MSLKIKLDDNFRIENDNWNIILIQRKKASSDKAKNDYVEKKTFRGTVEEALKFYARLSAINGDETITSVDDYVKKINQALDRTSQLIKEVPHGRN